MLGWKGARGTELDATAEKAFPEVCNKLRWTTLSYSKKIGDFWQGIATKTTSKLLSCLRRFSTQYCLKHLKRKPGFVPRAAITRR